MGLPAHHRADRPRHRAHGHRAHVGVRRPVVHGAHAGHHDRHGGGHRLRPLHRHPPPPAPGRGSRRGRGGRPGQRHRRRRGRVRRRSPSSSPSPASPSSASPSSRSWDSPRPPPCAIAVVIAITLLPALLGFAGHASTGSGARPEGPHGRGPRGRDVRHPVGPQGHRPPGGRARGRARRHGPAGHPVTSMRLGLHRRRHRAAVDDPAPGLRPARRGLRPRLQRAPHRRGRPRGGRGADGRPRPGPRRPRRRTRRRGGRRARAQRQRRHRRRHRDPVDGPRPTHATEALVNRLRHEVVPAVEASTGADGAPHGFHRRQHRHLRQARRRPADRSWSRHRADRGAAHGRVPLDPRAHQGGRRHPV